MEFTTPMEKLSSSNLEYLIQLCSLRITDVETDIRVKAADGVSISTLKNMIAEIDNVKELRSKLIDIKKGR